MNRHQHQSNGIGSDCPSISESNERDLSFRSSDSTRSSFWPTPNGYTSRHYFVWNQRHPNLCTRLRELPICLESAEMLCHIVLSMWNSVRPLVLRTRLNSRNLRRSISRLICRAPQLLRPISSNKNLTLIHPRILARYENTRDPN
jgi:hypothetical protein